MHYMNRMHDYLQIRELIWGKLYISPGTLSRISYQLDRLREKERESSSYFAKMMYFQLFTLLALFWCAEASYFRGSFVTWVVNQTDTRFYPANLSATYAKVHFQEIYSLCFGGNRIFLLNTAFSQIYCLQWVLTISALFRFLCKSCGK